MKEIQNYNQSRIFDRSIDELTGIVKGILADDIINTQEAIFLKEWIIANFEKSDLTLYPLNILLPRIQDALKDNNIDNNESIELKELLGSFAGGKKLSEQITSMTSTLPLTKPAPDIEFYKSQFCLTGKFTIGQRKVVEELIKAKGGIIKKDVVKTLDYLVIGIIGNQEWAHSSYGRKIEKAIYFNEQNANINIISEEHLIKFL